MSPPVGSSLFRGLLLVRAVRQRYWRDCGAAASASMLSSHGCMHAIDPPILLRVSLCSVAKAALQQAWRFSLCGPFFQIVPETLGPPAATAALKKKK